MTEVSAYEAESRLSQLLERARQGERIVITRHGTPVAELGPPARLCEAPAAAAPAFQLRNRRHCSAGNCAKSRSKVAHSQPCSIASAANHASGTRLPRAFIRMQRSAKIAQCHSPGSTAMLLGTSNSKSLELNAVAG